MIVDEIASINAFFWCVAEATFTLQDLLKTEHSGSCGTLA